MELSSKINQYQRNQNAATQSPSAVKNLQKMASTLQELQKGQVFEGTVKNMKNGQVTLLLSNGQTLKARLDGKVELSQGQGMFFQVKSNQGNVIAIRPFMAAGQPLNPTLYKALEAANLPLTQNHLTMVDEMMAEGMPVDSQSLIKMAQVLASNEGADIQTLVQMTKLGFSIDETSISQFTDYKNNEQALLGSMNQVADGIGQAIGMQSGAGEMVRLHMQVAQLFPEADGQPQTTGNGFGGVQNLGSLLGADGMVRLGNLLLSLQNGGEAAGSGTLFMEQTVNTPDGSSQVPVLNPQLKPGEFMAALADYLEQTAGEWSKGDTVILKSEGNTAGMAQVGGRVGVMVGQPGVMSGQPGVVPGQPGVVSGQVGVMPGQPGVVSGQVGVMPGQSDAVPGQPGVVSGQSGVVPGQPGVVPGQPGVMSGQSGVVPGQPGVVPGQVGVMSGQVGAVSGQSGVVPGQPGVMSGQFGVVPGQPGVVPGQPGVMSGQPGVMSGQPGVVPGQPYAVPDQSGIMQGQPVTMSGVLLDQYGVVQDQPGVVPGQPGVVPGQPGAVSGQSGVVPGQPGVVPDQPDAAGQAAQQTAGKTPFQAARMVLQSIFGQAASPEDGNPVKAGSTLTQIADREAGAQSGLGQPNQTAALLKSVFAGNEYQTLLKEALLEQWTMMPESVREEGTVERFYERLQEQMAKIQQMFSDNPAAGAQAAAKGAAETLNNVEMMNQINQLYNYVQIPLKLSDQNAHSELYVYTNKKNLRDKSGELSALLHLELEHLGMTDVMVKMYGNNVSAEFSLENSRSFELIKNNLDILKHRLELSGYSCRLEAKNKIEKKDFVKDFLEQDERVETIRRYSFDARA